MGCIEIIYFKAYNSLKGALNNNKECIEIAFHDYNQDHKMLNNNMECIEIWKSVRQRSI